MSGDLSASRSELRHDLEVLFTDALCIRGLNQEAAADALHIQVVAGMSHGNREQTKILLLQKNVQCALRELRRNNDFSELLGNLLGSFFGNFAVESDDAAEGRRRIALKGLAVGLFGIHSDSSAAGVGHA